MVTISSMTSFLQYVAVAEARTIMADQPPSPNGNWRTPTGSISHPNGHEILLKNDKPDETLHSDCDWLAYAW